MIEQTTFGTAVTDEERATTAARAATFVRPSWSATVDRLILSITEDQAFAFSSGRWSPGSVEPDLYVPGDVAAVRAFAASPSLRSALAFHDASTSTSLVDDTIIETHKSADSALGRAVALYDAVPFFVDPAMVEGLCGSTPPEVEDLDALRLPFESVAVYFGADFVVPDELIRFGPVAADAERRQEFFAQVAATLGGDPDSQRSLLSAAAESTTTVSGVVLFAGEGGVGLADDVVWMVTVPHVADWDGTVAQNDRMRGLVWGWRSAATLAPVAENLAAATAMLPWNTPQTVDLGDTDRARRRALRTGKGRRAYNRGELSGVRTVHIDTPTSTPTSPDSQERTHQSPVTHLRRGHWRRSRVGHRDEWTYRLIWIPPTVVNPSGSPDAATVRTYLLPTPAPRRTGPTVPR